MVQVPADDARIRAAGKFLFRGAQKIYPLGATYGTFRPSAAGDFDPTTVERDFAAMARAGVNAVRTYEVPPTWLLDAAHRSGLAVLVGIPWEQHVAFLDTRARVRSIEARIRAGVRSCERHPAVLCFAVGNEIPASIVRWHGPRRVERFVERLYAAAKSEDPDALVTYVNYPSTEYLDLPFLDLAAFNVYLESERQFEEYLARLQNLSGDRPLLMAEVGLDSRRNGEAEQARTVSSQLRTAFRMGCAGAFVFSWTDEWFRGGRHVDDWQFGLTSRDRRPKRALAGVGEVAAEVPFSANGSGWPRISVVVCSYNGGATLRECLDGLGRLDYPDYEVVVVDDGSADSTSEIAHEYGVRVIRTPNRGLSSARNTGLAASTGEIVAYLDSDATPDRHWLTYVAAEFLGEDVAAVGGPNLPPPDASTVSSCVASSPGGPTHVLVSDREAEHLPGCNMAFRKERLLDIGGFDPRFRVAGDDVDVCWRLRERGWKLAFHPAAMVWHRRRDSLRAYLRQQRGYGEAEALLEQKWPERYNRGGHMTWAGRVYAGFYAARWPLRRRIRYGAHGSGLFQSVYERSPGLLGALPLMPEWYLVIAGLAALSALGALWRPLLLTVPLLLVAVAALLVQAFRGARRACAVSPDPRAKQRRHVALTMALHLLQPLGRLVGRMKRGLTPWRLRSEAGFALPIPRRHEIWSEQWRSPDEWIAALKHALRRQGVAVFAGGEYDRWDLLARAGGLGAMCVRVAVEEHGSGRQLVRLRTWPRARGGLVLMAALAGLAVVCGAAGGWVPAFVLAGAAALVGEGLLTQCGSAEAAALAAFRGDSAEAPAALAPVRGNALRPGVLEVSRR